VKVFISWSGDLSSEVAEITSEWISSVIQAVEPWISSKDIERGALWFNDISDKLKDISIGIICLTQENKNSPWILFETGALTKGLETSRICTLLIDLKPTDIQGPLTHFNHTEFDKVNMLKLVKTINNQLNNRKVENEKLVKTFELYWPDFEDKIKKAITKNSSNAKTEPRLEESIMEEILETVRNIDNRVLRIDNKTPIPNRMSHPNNIAPPPPPQNSSSQSEDDIPPWTRVPQSPSIPPPPPVSTNISQPTPNTPPPVPTNSLPPKK